MNAINRLLRKKQSGKKLVIEYYLEDKKDNWEHFLNEFNDMLESIEKNKQFKKLYECFLDSNQNFISALLELKVARYLLKGENWLYEPYNNSPDFINDKLKSAFEVKASSLSILVDFLNRKSIELSKEFRITKELFIDIHIKWKTNNLQDALINNEDKRKEFYNLFSDIYDFIKENNNSFRVGFKEDNDKFTIEILQNKERDDINISLRFYDFKDTLSKGNVNRFDNFTIFEKQLVSTLRNSINKKLESNFKLNLIIGTFRVNDAKKFMLSKRFEEFANVDLNKLNNIYLVNLYEIRQKGLNVLNIRT